MSVEESPMHLAINSIVESMAKALAGQGQEKAAAEHHIIDQTRALLRQKNGLDDHAIEKVIKDLLPGKALHLLATHGMISPADAQRGALAAFQASLSARSISPIPVTVRRPPPPTGSLPSLPVRAAG